MKLPPPRPGYEWIAVESYKNPGEPSDMPIRAKPIAGQGIDINMHVECSEKMRMSQPIGTYFMIEAKLTVGTQRGACVYTYHGWKWHVIDREAAVRHIKERCTQK